MIIKKEPSITNWVDRLKNNKLYAILSGFDPDDVPGIGTFYDFIDRLTLADKQLRRKRKNQRKRFKRKPTPKLKKNEKLHPKHPEIVDKIVKNGQKVFNRCDCKRKFSDPDAAWGWDSYREKWIYGYSFYELNAASSPFDLPLFFIQAQAKRHDSVLAPFAFEKLYKLLTDKYHLAKFLADSAHDNFPTYKLMDKLNSEPFIPINQRNKGNFTYQPCKINHIGQPVCNADQPMVYDGYCPDRMRIKWRCPSKANKNFNKENICQKFNYCYPSDYGRVVYTYPKKNLRLFNKTPRGSDKWLKTYDKRTSAERSNKRKKTDYKIEQARVKSREQCFCRYALTAICQHLDAWTKISNIDFKELCLSWQLETQ